MKIISPRYEILTELNGSEILRNIERAGRVCYKSENRTDNSSALSFIKNIILRGHESVLEHESVSVRFVCDRGVTHEIVRHRIASYSQESTRYCNYCDDKFGNELTFIEPLFYLNRDKEMNIWSESMRVVEKNYLALIMQGSKPEEARSILPNSIKTEIIVTMNLREWRHFFKLRTSNVAHPQMRQITIPLLTEMKTRIPIIFDDIFI